MSLGRLTFLYPHFFKPFITNEVKTARAAKQQCPRRPAGQAACISTGRPARQDSAFAKRHGKAVEPVICMPPPDQPRVDKQGKLPGSDKVQTPSASPEASPQSSPNPTVGSKANNSNPINNSKGGNSRGARQKTKNSRDVTDQKEASSAPKEPGGGQASVDVECKKKDLGSGPMETVLQEGESPRTKGKSKQKKPAMSPPPYIHSFDTYMMTKRLETGGFTEAQSIQGMKAIRWLLSMNLSKARDVLVSKSDVENETYLFRAACSELSAEVQNNRRAADEHMRQQRTMIQHEVDILTQNLNHELATLEDTVKNVFNERRMAVREEESEIQGAIQQLNLKISAKINGDARSDIEGVRWTISRMAAGGIGFVGLLVLATFRYVSTTKKSRKEEAEKTRQEVAEKRRQEEEERMWKAEKMGKLDHSYRPAADEALPATN